MSKILHTPERRPQGSESNSPRLSAESCCNCGSSQGLDGELERRVVSRAGGAEHNCRIPERTRSVCSGGGFGEVRIHKAQQPAQGSAAEGKITESAHSGLQLERQKAGRVLTLGPSGSRVYFFLQGCDLAWPTPRFHTSITASLSHPSPPNQQWDT